MLYRKHIAEFRGAIEETTIEDIHHQTNQWQLNTYRENNMPTRSHIKKHYHITNYDQNGVLDNNNNNNNKNDKDKLTSLLLGYDNEEEDASQHQEQDHYAVVRSEKSLQDIDYIGHPSNNNNNNNEEKRSDHDEINAESERIIHLQVLREKVSM